MPVYGLFLLTLRELRARKVVAGLFLVATLVWLLLALALRLDVVDGGLAGLRLFGSEQTGDDLAALGANPLERVTFAIQGVVTGVAYWMGIFLALFASGGLVATMLERGPADVLLSKPVSRSALLAARLLGIGAMMLALVTYLLGAVWLVMSVKTGIWNPRFLLAVPVLFAMFAVMYGFVTLVSVRWQSGPLALIVTYALIFASLVLAVPGLAELVALPWRHLVVGLYHVVPHFAEGTQTVSQLATGEAVTGWRPLLSSLAVGALAYAGAFLQLRRRDF